MSPSLSYFTLQKDIYFSPPSSLRKIYYSIGIYNSVALTKTQIGIHHAWESLTRFEKQGGLFWELIKEQPLIYLRLAVYSQLVLSFRSIYICLFVYFSPFLSAHMLELDFRSEMSVMVTHEHAYLNKKKKPNFPEFSDKEKWPCY